MDVQESRPRNPNLDIPHRDTGDEVFGRHLYVNARMHQTVSSPTSIYGFDDLDNTMGDINNELFLAPPERNVCANCLSLMHVIKFCSFISCWSV
jgi:hypothetical protein